MAKKTSSQPQKKPQERKLSNTTSWILGIMFFVFAFIYMMLAASTGHAIDYVTSFLYFICFILMVPPTKALVEMLINRQIPFQAQLKIFLILTVLAMGSTWLSSRQLEESVKGNVKPLSTTPTPSNPEQYVLLAKRGIFWGAINLNGNWVIKEQYDDSLAAAKALQSRYPKVVTSQNPQPLAPNVLADLKKKGLVANPNGNNTRFLVFDQKNYGFCDTTGRMIIPAQFRYATAFQGGFARVLANTTDGLRWGIIDVNGHEVLPAQFLNLGSAFYKP